jgi:uridine kinase
MIIAPSNYCELRARVSDVLGPERKPLIIGFDGRNGEGKTSAATWLAWQFGMSAIHLDLFIEEQKSEGGAICKWRTDDLARCLKRRGAKPIIVEGVLLLDVLSSIEKAADFLVFVEKVRPQPSRDRSSDDDLDTREFSLGNQISRYLERRKPLTRAHFRLSWIDTWPRLKGK